MHKIEFRHVSKAFGAQQVLQELNMTVTEGESLVVIGRSGCGKSVMLKHMIGLMKPDAGMVLVDGEDITVMKRRDLFRVRGKFGVLFQGAALLDSLTVAENVGLGLRERTAMSPTEIACVVEEKLEMVGMPGIEDYMPADLSGGMKKRVGLARAIAMNPEIVLYDEPTTGLDPIMADNINELIIQLKHELNITSIVVTHDMISARKVGDRVTMLQDGEMVYSGSVASLDTTDDPVVRQFVEGRSDGPLKPRTLTCPPRS